MKEWLLIVSLILLFLLTGCQNQGVQKQIESKEVRIGILNVPNDVAMSIGNHRLQKAYQQKGVKVTFITFDSGVDANKALLSNSIDFATMGDANAIVALAADVPAKLIWLNDLIGDNEALVMKESIESVEDLAGKRLATTFASTSYYSLLQYLKTNHLEDKVQLFDLQTQEIVAAWERGDIDGAYTWQPALAKLIDGQIIYDSQQATSEGIITGNVTLVRTQFMNSSPELVQLFVDILNQTHQEYQRTPKTVIKTLASELALTEAEVNQQIGSSRWLVKRAMKRELTGNFFKALEKTGDFLGERQNLVFTPEESDYQKFVVSKFLE
ncbi:MAG: ABC transporter substrate-binding protein [Enterococcus sp.]